MIFNQMVLFDFDSEVIYELIGDLFYNRFTNIFPRCVLDKDDYLCRRTIDEEKGILRKEAFYFNGEFHKKDGPAYSYWNDTGKKIDSEHWVSGQRKFRDKK